MQVTGETTPPNVALVLLAKQRPLTYYMLNGCPICPVAPVFYFNNDHQAVLLSLRTRVLGCYINGQPVARLPVHPRAYRVDSFTRRMFAAASLVTPLSLEASCARFKGPRQAVYSVRLKQLQQMGLGGVDYPCGRTFTLRNFLKVEAYNKPTAHPRMIRSYDEGINIIFGTICFPLATVLKENINDYVSENFNFPSPMVLSGGSRDLQASHIINAYNSLTARTHEPIVIVVLDGNRYDYHVGVEALRWTHKIYLAAPSDWTHQLQAYFKARERPEKNIVRCNDALVMYKSDPQRSSGSDDTWLGNTLIACKLIVEVVDVLYKEGCVVIQAFDNSDDVRFMLPQSWLARFQQVFLNVATNYGFRFEVEKVTTNIREFLWMQSHVLYDGKKYRLIRDVRRAMTRDFCTPKRLIDEEYYYGWLAAVGLGGLITFGDCPILGAMYDCMWRHSRGYQPAQDVMTEYWWGTDAIKEIGEYGLMLSRLPAKQRLEQFSKKYEETRLLRPTPSLTLRAEVFEADGFLPAEQVWWEGYFDQLDLTWSHPSDAGSSGPTLF